MQDPYQILGLNQQANKEEVKKAYRKLAAKFHPDNKETGDEKKAKEINAAYEAITNPKQQEQFNNQSPFSGFNNIDLGDFFQQIHQNQVFTPPEPIEINLELTFRDAVLGCEKDISFERNILCGKCEGSGKKFSQDKCIKCNGQGKIKESKRQQNYMIQQIIDCKECNGYGKKIESNCQECNGKQAKLNTTTGKIKIPYGILTGQAIRLQGAGNQTTYNNRAIAGDVFIKVTVIHYENLTYNQRNECINSKLEISLLEALTGSTKKIHTIDGEKDIEIPKLTHNADILDASLDLIEERRTYHWVEIHVNYPQTNEELQQLSEYLISQKKENTNGNDPIL